MSVLKWGLIGGGEGSQIGPAHRLGARLDGLFEFSAAALDHRPEAGRAYGQTLGLPQERAYGDWREMLGAETGRADGIDLVTIATPNDSHYEITKAYLEAGIHVFCEKPMTMTVEEGEEIVRLAQKQDLICAVNYGYTGYPLVRHMREMVARGDLGAIRLVRADFAHGHHADAQDADNPRIRWRYDPSKIGVSAQFADCGIHALHMASFVCAQESQSLSADLISAIPSRQLEDDAMVNIRMSGGATVRLWTSSVALGRQHGLALQVFGEKGGMSWSQEQPNQIYFTALGGRTEIIERGTAGLSAAHDSANRVTVGHAEGMPLAFANLYRDLHAAISAKKEGRALDAAHSHFPTAEDGLRSIAAIYAVAQSGRDNGAWCDARPPLFR